MTDQNTKKPLFAILKIDRAEIAASYIESAYVRLLALTDTTENAYRFRDSVIFSITGYANDSRELHEIPEIRAFFAKLTDKWPFWLWFLNRESGALARLVSCLCDVSSWRTENGLSLSFPSEQVTLLLEDLNNRSVAMFSSLGITEQDYTQSLDGACLALS